MRSTLLGCLLLAACHLGSVKKESPKCEFIQESENEYKYGAVIQHKAGYCDVSFVKPYGAMPKCLLGTMTEEPTPNYTTRPNGLTVYDLDAGKMIFFICKGQ